MTLHKDLAQGRWYTLSVCAQLANIGSEFGRACRAFHTQNESRFTASFDRMHELLCLSVSDPRWSYHRKKEINRLKELVCYLFFEKTATKTLEASLEKDFYAYTLSARKR